MSRSALETRNAILTAACELFGEHGFDAVSTRMIADKAGVNLGGIHYHFGSKGGLYEEAIKAAHSLEPPLSVERLLEEMPDLLSTPAGKAHAVYRIVTDYFRRQPLKIESWRRNILFRELIDPSEYYLRIHEEYNIQATESMLNLYFTLVPDGNLADACTWISYPVSQVIFYISGNALNKKLLDEVTLDNLYRSVVKTTTRAMILLLDLPVPALLLNPTTDTDKK
ncbi:MAG: TetR/AcrR family transcriptional regulator [Planctomycetaceae bacterium]|jgi:AcrR family transcriptional regulator|nr:TetR/AcrR family transcriptional regulator [Planctomycetaceae bacterium]